MILSSCELCNKTVVYVVPLETQKSDDNGNNHYRLQTGKGMLDRKEVPEACWVGPTLQCAGYAVKGKVRLELLWKGRWPFKSWFLLSHNLVLSLGKAGHIKDLNRGFPELKDSSCLILFNKCLTKWLLNCLGVYIFPLLKFDH